MITHHLAAVFDIIHILFLIYCKKTVLILPLSVFVFFPPHNFPLKSAEQTWRYYKMMKQST